MDIKRALLGMILCSLFVGFPGVSSVRSVSASPGATATLALDWSLAGTTSGVELGAAVSAAGDVNADGFTDVLIGAPKDKKNIDREGVVYVFYGGPAGLSDTPDVVLAGGIKGAYFGAAVSAAGDVNGDDIDDVIVGAPYYPAPEGGKLGAAFVFYGSATGLRDVPDWTLLGHQTDMAFGTAVTGAGDLNGDGYADVAVGAPLAGEGEGSEGHVFVFLGSPTGPAAVPSQTLESNQVGARFGQALDGAGDVNGDGYDDLLVGAPYYDDEEEDVGAAFVFFGTPNGVLTAPAWQRLGDEAGAYTGAAVSAAGDANGDGFADIAVGSPGRDGAHQNQGQAQLFYGSALGPGRAAGWSATGPAYGARLGAALSGGADVNADGYDDLVVGVPYATTSPDGTAQSEPERVLVYLGSPQGLRYLPTWQLETNQSTTEFGAAVALVGRANVDDYDDIVVGAAYYKQDRILVGRAFLYLGAAGGETYARIHLPLTIKVGPR